MATLLRPIKTGNVRTYVEEAALGFDVIDAPEIDADLDTIYTAFSNLTPLPTPTASDVGKVLVVQPGPYVVWQAPAVIPTPPAPLWADDTDYNMLYPVGGNRGIRLPAGGEGLVIAHSNYPTIDRRTGIDADDVTLQIHAGSAGIQFKTWDSTAILAQLLPSGRLTLGADPSAPLDAATKQYVDMHAGSGGGGDGVWTDDTDWYAVYPTATGRNVLIRGDFAELQFAATPEDVGLKIVSRLSYPGGAALDYKATLGHNWIVGASAVMNLRAEGLGIGRLPTERLTVEGGIRIAAASLVPIEGTIQWDGTHFQGFDGGAWVNLDEAGGSGGGDSLWTDDTANNTLKPATAGRSVLIEGATSSLALRIPITDYNPTWTLGWASRPSPPAMDYDESFLYLTYSYDGYPGYDIARFSDLGAMFFDRCTVERSPINDKGGVDLRLKGYGGPTAALNKITGAMWGGTVTVPAATKSGDAFITLTSEGTYSAIYDRAYDKVQIALKADENWLFGANGTRIDFLTCPKGSASVGTSMHLHGGLAKAFLGIGTSTATVIDESLALARGAVVGPSSNASPAAGTIDYTAGRFRGRNATAWVNLDEAAGGGETLWGINNDDYLSPLNSAHGLQLAHERKIQWELVDPDFIGASINSSYGTIMLMSGAGGDVRFGVDGAMVALISAQGYDSDLSIRVGANVRPSPWAGTIQYAGGRFQGYHAGAWVNLDEAAGGGASGWTDTGPVLYATTLTKPVAIGTTSTPPAGTVLHLKKTAGTVNGDTSLRIENTTPSTNEKIATRYVGGANDIVVGLSTTTTVDYGLWFGGPIGNAMFRFENMSSSGFRTAEIMLAEWFSVSLGNAQTSYIPYVKGNAVAASGGASSVATFTMKNFEWVWPGNPHARHWRFRFSGTITRAAGQAGLTVRFGNKSALVTVFDWLSTAAAWATAAWELDVFIFVDGTTGKVATRLSLAPDPVAPAPAQVTTYFGRYALTGLQTAGGANVPNLQLQGRFDTSNASNLIVTEDFSAFGHKTL